MDSQPNENLDRPEKPGSKESQPEMPDPEELKKALGELIVGYAYLSHLDRKTPFNLAINNRQWSISTIEHNTSKPSEEVLRTAKLNYNGSMVQFYNDLYVNEITFNIRPASD